MVSLKVRKKYYKGHDNVCTNGTADFPHTCIHIYSYLEVWGQSVQLHGIHSFNDLILFRFNFD